jgi:hypothetical protein
LRFPGFAEKRDSGIDAAAEERQKASIPLSLFLSLSTGKPKITIAFALEDHPLQADI